MNVKKFRSDIVLYYETPSRTTFNPIILFSFNNKNLITEIDKCMGKCKKNK